MECGTIGMKQTRPDTDSAGGENEEYSQYTESAVSQDSILNSQLENSKCKCGRAANTCLCNVDSPAEEFCVASEDEYVETNPIDDSSSDSDGSSIHGLVDILPVFDESTESQWSDHESEGCADDQESMDPELWIPFDRKKYWSCRMCDATQLPPRKFCEDCYERRKAWLGPQKKRKRRQYCTSTKMIIKNLINNCRDYQSKHKKTSPNDDHDYKDNTAHRDSDDNLFSSTEGDMDSTGDDGDSDVQLALTQQYAEVSVIEDCVDGPACSNVEIHSSTTEPSTSQSCFDGPLCKGTGCSAPIVLPAGGPVQKRKITDTVSEDCVDGPINKKRNTGTCDIGEDCVDGPVKNRTASTDATDPEANDSVEHCSQGSLADSGYSGSQEFCSQESSSQNASTQASHSSTQASDASTQASDASLCQVCCTREADAAFVHGNLAHKGGCYQCFYKIMRTTNQCMLCRRRIYRVVKIV